MPRGQYIRTEEFRARMQLLHKGQVVTDLQIQRLSAALKGNRNHPKGSKHTHESIQKMSEAHKAQAKPSRLGTKQSDEARRKIGEASRNRKPNLGKVFSPEWRAKLGAARRGEKNGLWKGGITPENRRIRASPEYKAWRVAVFQRDKWTCVLCGAKGGKGVRVVIHADHIKPFSTHPELRMDASNGRTLCEPCHRGTDTFGLKACAHGRERVTTAA